MKFELNFTRYFLDSKFMKYILFCFALISFYATVAIIYTDSFLNELIEIFQFCYYVFFVLLIIVICSSIVTFMLKNNHHFKLLFSSRKEECKSVLKIQFFLLTYLFIVNFILLIISMNFIKSMNISISKIYDTLNIYYLFFTLIKVYGISLLLLFISTILSYFFGEKYSLLLWIIVFIDLICFNNQTMFPSCLLLSDFLKPIRYQSFLSEVIQFILAFSVYSFLLSLFIQKVKRSGKS